MFSENALIASVTKIYYFFFFFLRQYPFHPRNAPKDDGISLTFQTSNTAGKIRSLRQNDLEAPRRVQIYYCVCMPVTVRVSVHYIFF